MTIVPKPQVDVFSVTTEGAKRESHKRRRRVSGEKQTSLSSITSDTNKGKFIRARDSVFVLITTHERKSFDSARPKSEKDIINKIQLAKKVKEKKAVLPLEIEQKRHESIKSRGSVSSKKRMSTYAVSKLTCADKQRLPGDTINLGFVTIPEKYTTQRIASIVKILKRDLELRKLFTG